MGLRTLKAGPQEPSCALGWSQTLSSALACHAATGRPLYPSANICAQKLLAGRSLHVRPPPPGREETPTEPLGEGGRSQNRGPLGEREAPMQGHPGREEPPHRAPGGGGEETPCGAGGLFAERALEGTKSLQGTGCPKGQPHFPPAEPGQASLLPASSGPRDDKCLLQTCFTWVYRPCPQDHHLS